MKRRAFVLVFAVVGIAAFASGVAEQDTGSPAAPGSAGAYGSDTARTAEPTPFGPAMRARAVTQGQETTVTGTYDEIDGYPVLRVGEKTYTVGVPGYRWLDVELEPGDEVTVEGFLLEESEPVAGHMRVQTATINGTEYEVTPPGYGRAWSNSGGQGYGPGWGRGPAGHGRGYGHYHHGYGSGPAPGYGRQQAPGAQRGGRRGW